MILIDLGWIILGMRALWLSFGFPGVDAGNSPLVLVVRLLVVIGFKGCCTISEVKSRRFFGFRRSCISSGYF